MSEEKEKMTIDSKDDQILKDKNDDLDLKLRLSMSKKHTKEADDLIKNGANPHAVDNNLRTLLHEAAYYGNVENVRWLVETHELNIMARDYYGDTPAHTAARVGSLDAIIWLMDNGADINATNDGGETIQELFVRYSSHLAGQWNSHFGEQYRITIPQDNIMNVTNGNNFNDTTNISSEVMKQSYTYYPKYNGGSGDGGGTGLI